MVQSTQDTAVFTREIHIKATPEIVYDLLTDPDKLSQWTGTKVEVDQRPGGIIRVDYNGFDISSGKIIEYVPHSRVVYTYGWETLGDATPPGQATVEITLTPESGGTRLKMIVTGLRGSEIESNSQGWTMYMDEVARRAEGDRSPGQIIELTQGETLASRLNSALIVLRYAIEDCAPDRWTTQKTEEDWTIAAAAGHVLGHTHVTALVVKTIAEGGTPDMASASTESIQGMIKQALDEAATTPKDAMLARVLSEGPQAVVVIRGLTTEGLQRSVPFAMADGAPVVASQFAESMLNDIEQHVANVRKAVGPAR